ncbi:unnamed protein product [Eruca vesicaria subsp. sativa]|uniref:ubiquitinyl hydrolase 1 n=1 Tax=Eruca vesicaria subsp. sativa TaxID=29727 RepID=A0ABC8IV73_ERUVS|nr:unnamed protein product [Eruca vesicaria subsp. sativa]
MARILVQRGSSSNASRSASTSSSGSSSSSSSGSSSSSSGSGTESQVSSDVQAPPVTIYEETTDEKQDEVSVVEEQAECSDAKDVSLSDAKDVSLPSDEPLVREDDEALIISENVVVDCEGVDSDSPVSGGDDPDSPPLPVPPPKPSSNVTTGNRRSVLGSFGDLRIGATRRVAVPRSLVSTRGSPTGSHPSSPRSQSENEGYNSSDEHMPCFVPSHAGSGSGSEREHQFETEIRQSKGFEIRRMLEDGNCLFRAVADQVYGDSESYDLTRQMCMDYMEHERDHFSQFITEGFTSYLKRKRRDKVYGNNVEIQALAEMYNRPIHIYSYSTEPINIFQGSYNTDTPPIRLSYHHGNHYNSLVDPHRLTVGAGLGFSSLTGRHVDGEQVKAAIKAQQEHQIDNALIAEGRYYSDLELTEKEIERSVMEASRAEYLMERSKPRIGPKESSTSNAETSSSGARTSAVKEKTVLSSSIEMVLSMGFSYTQAMEAYSIFGDDVDSMVCYVLETSCGSNNRRKGKATE